MLQGNGFAYQRTTPPLNTHISTNPAHLTNHPQYERRTYITPFLRHYIRITLFSLFKTALTSAIVLGAVGYVAWRVFLFEQWVADVEYEGNVDANQALEDMEEDSKARKKGKEKVKRDADKILEEGGK